jgi:ABC-type dipeptide/oligopeptide/nickel transport system permease component
VFKFSLKRIALTFVVIWVVVTLTFMLMHAVPGNPFAKEGRMPESIYKNLQRHYNLDKPLIEQYWIYLKSVLKLDLGPSMKSQTMTVNDIIGKGFPVSAHLGLQSLFVAVTLGVLLGIIAALKHNKWQDYSAMVLSIIGISVPSFILATVLINFVAVEWKLLPVATWKSVAHTILPTISLAMLPLAYIARLMRSSMLDVLSQDYIKTAKAKGLSQSTVIIKHGIRNAILPVVTVLGVTATNLLTGSFVIEKIFGIPGMGEMFVKGISNRDYPVILGSTIFYSALLTVLTLIVDIAYKLIDPRIKISGGTE